MFKWEEENDEFRKMQDKLLAKVVVECSGLHLGS